VEVAEVLVPQVVVEVAELLAVGEPPEHLVHLLVLLLRSLYLVIITSYKNKKIKK
jgi:hypothetical protein